MAGVKIIVRGDSGFCRNELMSWCESHGVDFAFGMARNKKLRRIIGAQMHEATEQWKQTGKPARVFTDIEYQIKKTKKGGWDRAGAWRRKRNISMEKRIRALLWLP